MTYLAELFVILLLTKIAAHYSVKLKMPSVIGELLVGIVIGPAMLNWIHPTTFINYFSELGVIVLMFIAGLEGDLKLLIKYWAPALTVATLGVIVPTGTAFLLCHNLFNFSVKASVFMGLVLSATSVSITIQVLKEMHRLNTRAGAIICGAAVADDIICVILLGIASSIYGTSQHESIWLMVLKMFLFFVIVLLIGKFIVPKFLSIFQDLNATESDTAGAMILCFGTAALAVMMGMSDVLGAYFAGLAISETDFEDHLEDKIEPIGYAVFIPVFFVSIGLQISFKGMQNDIVFIILLIITAILGKQIGCGLAAKMFHLSWTESNVVGAGMVSRGEMALVVANVALSSHLIDQNHYTAMILVTVITTLVAPLILKLFILKSNKKVAAKDAVSIDNE
ncbi:cation:proton antiporter [Lactobacillus intestinalis]|uniref:Na+ H+ antiporter n=1 Tax=Lactobacillus intestinalis DSM 6629 TaxID=1423761 RepID=A0ABR5PU61_9LACO|nr:cation:proton antiporter [Lactobacillus intestinalis]KRM34699.1 Na+ H+ antiporter [Lactobacillus intestinalis DSM 6629]UTW41130.1 cation:proton antiporter [Lactobacillus intestinalis]